VKPVLRAPPVTRMMSLRAGERSVRHGLTSVAAVVAAAVHPIIRPVGPLRVRLAPDRRFPAKRRPLENEDAQARGADTAGRVTLRTSSRRPESHPAVTRAPRATLRTYDVNGLGDFRRTTGVETPFYDSDVRLEVPRRRA